MNVLPYLLNHQAKGEKMLALLIDPDTCPPSRIGELRMLLSGCMPHLILVGGSLVTTETDRLVKELKAMASVPVVLFPGNVLQLTPAADALLFLSLLSGRNAEFLIGQQVVAAPLIRRAELETISTGYLLVDGNRATSVQYMSNTMPIPADKSDIAIATALAGQMLGMQSIYLEAGSGADVPVPVEMIEQVRKAIQIPLWVGGGLNTAEKVGAACRAGADVVVVGNALEKSPDLLKLFLAEVSRHSG